MVTNNPLLGSAAAQAALQALMGLAGEGELGGAARHCTLALKGFGLQSQPFGLN